MCIRDREGGRETLGAKDEDRMDLDRPGDDNAANKVNITSKLQTIDYSHGSSYSNVKSVDYNHGAMGAPPQPPPTDAFRDPAYPPAFDIPGYGSGGGRHLPYPSPYEGYQYPPGGGGYPPAPPGTFFPPGFDAATLFAAYASQAGTVFIHLDLHVLLLYSGKFSRGKFFTNFPDSVISRVRCSRVTILCIYMCTLLQIFVALL